MADVSREVGHLHEMVTAAYGIFAEARNLNLKPPLQANSNFFHFAEMSDDADAPAATVAATAEPDADARDMTLHGDEIQDSFTKIGAFKTAYIRHSMELMEAIAAAATPSPLDMDELVPLVQRRDHLRKEVHERNVVMKGLIDRLRALQQALCILQGMDHANEDDVAAIASARAMEEV
ncbi:hypothetical protein SDRG_16440 [Saprolegnia diclina VS20]|uniref:Uncharacterized protein n=1 Tax=Saprolegnia diclina (strain VS20) TaxID=1156394 RepID=T0R882_SAPDV|nr:hypothetical protein SDRG_16440 [Saprolegnia diclina VS20]EQC25702.1 hypothetical protein SDRG_16440 [Saprolegnia diclina VS20]|eukprot:XP_008620872.1 hypothetical protein SDRG_16440 [Saprolegnia diclina VS20]